MRSTLGSASIVWFSLLQACSALVDPDPSRLGGRAGPVPGDTTLAADGSVADDVTLPHDEADADDVPLADDVGVGVADDVPLTADGGVADDVALTVDAAVPCTAPRVTCGTFCLDLATDVTSCGTCGLACAPGQGCVLGVCACAPTDPACGRRGLTDPTACGPAAERCRRGKLCIDGECRCRPPLSPVGDECVDLATDPDHCGTPRARCDDAVCAMGRCVEDCPDGTRDCHDACVDLRRDSLNCGECGRGCRATEACQDGACRDVELARGCASCPCDVCRGGVCCLLPRYDVPYCLDADRCP